MRTVCVCFSHRRYAVASLDPWKWAAATGVQLLATGVIGRLMVTYQLDFILKHFIKLWPLWFNGWLCNPPIRKWGTGLYIVDFKKAFDSISRDKLWVTMMDMGYPLHLIDILAQLYGIQPAKVKVAGTLLLLLLLLYRTQSTHKKHITQHRTTSNNKQRLQTLKKKLFNIYY